MSSYKFFDIKYCSPEEGKSYFFDANVWLIILRPLVNPTNREIGYINFFEAIVNLSSNHKCKQKPEIIINSLVLSEIFNAYLRSSYRTFLDKEGKNDTFEFKRHYRKTQDFDNNVKNFKSEFLAYNNYFTIKDDCVINIDPLDMIANFPCNTDFNDYYYYLYCIENNLAIVTDDGDFIYQGVEIISNNKYLLEL